VAQEWVRLGPPDLEFEAISKDDPDVHAQVSAVLSLLMDAKEDGRAPRTGPA
jgi:hypothetical protein